MAFERQGRQRASIGTAGDDYWDESEVSRKKFDLFADEDDLDYIARMKEDNLRQAIHDDAVTSSSGWGIEDDVVEPAAIELKTESVGYVATSSSAVALPVAGSARFRADSQPRLTPKSSTADLRSATPTSQGSPVTDHRTHSRASSSVSDVIIATTREPVQAELVKLQAKINQLERKLQKEQIGDVSIEQTIKRMLLGRPYLLEPYRSLADKKRLLAKAVETHDGNVINAVLDFLKETLTATLFRRCMLGLGVIPQYVNFLIDRQAVVESCDMLTSDGRSNEAAIRQYRYAMRTVDVPSRVRQIDAVFKKYFSSDPLLEADRPFIHNQLSLLRIQQAIQQADDKVEATHPLLKQYKRVKPLVACPLMQSLFYCCFYHFDEPPTSYSSPKYLTASYQISDKQFQWVATRTLSTLKRWNQLDALFSGKSFFGKKTLNSCIGFENVVSILRRTNAPPDVMNSYCALITPSEERLRVAHRFECHIVIIDTLVASKDRVELENFARKVKPGSTEAVKIRNALSNSSIKWKN